MVEPSQFTSGTKVINAKSATGISSPAVISTPFSFNLPLVGKVTTCIFCSASLSTSVNLSVKLAAVKAIGVFFGPTLVIVATTGGSFTGVMVMFTLAGTAA